MLERIAALCALTILAGPSLASATLIPGAGSLRTECYVQLDVDTPYPPETRQRAFCVDGDPKCDHDGLCNGSCTFRARLCVSVNDPDLRQCTPPPALKRLTVRNNLLPLPASPSGSGCGEFAPLVVPQRGPIIRPRPGKLALHVTAVAGHAADHDRYVLVCGPRFDDCPPQPTTTTSTTGAPTTTTTTSTSSTSSTTEASTTTTSTIRGSTTTSSTSSSTTTTSSPTTTSTTTTSSTSTTTSTSSTTTTTTSTTQPTTSTTSSTTTTTSSTTTTTSEPTTTTSTTSTTTEESTTTTEQPATTTTTTEESTTTTAPPPTAAGH